MQKHIYFDVMKEVMLSRPCGEPFLEVDGIEGYVTPYIEPEGVLLAFAKTCPENRSHLLEQALASIGRYRRVTWVDWETDGVDTILIKQGFQWSTRLQVMHLDLSEHRAVTPSRIQSKRVQLEEAEAVLPCIASDLGYSIAFAREVVFRKKVDSEYERCAFFAYFDETIVSYGFLDLAKTRSYAILRLGGSLPQYRGMGAYRALFAKRLQFARELGIQDILTVSVEKTSAPILSKMGMKSIGNMDLFTKIN